MSIKKLIQEHKKKKFSSVEEAIYETMISNSNNIIKLTASDISKLIPCNHSSVSRFINKIGFSSWREFIVSCIFEEKVKSKIGINSIQEKIFLEIANAQTALELPKNKKIIQDIVDVFLSVEKNLIFYGYRLTGNIAQYLTWIFTSSNLFATHTYFLEELFGLLKQDSILVCFSDDEGEKETVEAIKRARLIGAKVIVINIEESKIIRDIAHITLEIPQLSYFIDYKYNNILKKELMRHIGLKIWEEWQNQKNK